MSLELARPPGIDDDYCDFTKPTVREEHTSSMESPNPLSELSESAVAIDLLTEVARSISTILKAESSLVLSFQSIQSMDAQFLGCLSTLPPHYQLRSESYIDPLTTLPIVFLQDARLSIHRRHIAPTCTTEIRSSSISNCLRIARDTANYLSRTMHDPSLVHDSELATTNWQKRIRSAASAFLCLHIWRCTLLLAFGGDYKAAHLCARTSAAIGDARPVNASCGRYLEFFLQQLTAVLQRGEGSYLECNEDMLAYLSSDLQSNVENAWVWQRGDTSTPQLETRGTGDIDPLPYQDTTEVLWNGWERVLNVLEMLDEQRQGRPDLYRIRPSPPKRDAGFLSPRTEPNSAVVSPGGSNRISIADIMR